MASSRARREECGSVNLGQVNLFVADFPAMLRFYRDQLGLQLMDIEPGPPAVPLVNWASLVAGNMIVELFDAVTYGREVQQIRESWRDAMQLCFIVDDVEVERKRLVAQGVACTEVIAEEWGRYSWFADPEGNHLQIYQVNDRSAPS